MHIFCDNAWRYSHVVSDRRHLTDDEATVTRGPEAGVLGGGGAGLGADLTRDPNEAVHDPGPVPGPGDAAVKIATRNLKAAAGKSLMVTFQGKQRLDEEWDK